MSIHVVIVNRLFVEIIFCVQTITFRSTSLFKMQNGHALTHIFSLHLFPPFTNNHSSCFHLILQDGEVIPDKNEKIWDENLSLSLTHLRVAIPAPSAT